ncbi:MAG: M20/M25/M40 family metallo-hydrolase [Oscillospiraceae bacterium]|nr:M20/M25/M40 family metallo-hydrolase [Oscillospiraceae bacterium]
MEIIEVFRRLVSAPSPSGAEQDAAQAVRELLGPLADRVETDVLGNVIGARLCGKKNAKKLLIEAHIDEIGFIVTGHEEGFVKFAPLGGVDARTLPGAEVTVLGEKPLYGVTACLPPHVLTAEEREKAFEIQDMYIDLGLSRQEAEKAAPVGTRGIFRGDILLRGGDIISRALDDKLCAAVLLCVMDDIKDAELDADVYFMAGVQEEVGMRGAGAGAFRVDPDIVIATDVTFASAPDCTEGTFKPGSGPAIGVGPNADRALSKAMIRTAEKEGIPYSVEVMPKSSGTDAWVMQICRGGTATAIVSVPIKNMHSSVETARISDAENTRRLLSAFIRGGIPKC